MPDDATRADVFIPYPGNFVIYPSGAREDGTSVLIEMPGHASLGSKDWFSFAFFFGALIQVEDEHIEEVAAILAPHRRMRDFQLGGKYLTWRALKAMTVFDQLEELIVSGIHEARPRDWAMLERFACLTTLTVSGPSGFTDAALKTIARLPKLETLRLEECNDLTDTGAETLSRSKSLKSVSFSTPHLTDRGVAALAKLDGLRSLLVSTTCNITDRSLRILAELPDLRYLSLPNCRGPINRLVRGGISRKGLRCFLEAKPECDYWSREFMQGQKSLIDQF